MGSKVPKNVRKNSDEGGGKRQSRRHETVRINSNKRSDEYRKRGEVLS